jgi:hypothetical protein
MGVVDDLAFQQSLIGGFALGVGAIVVTWVVAGRRGHLHGPTSH